MTATEINANYLDIYTDIFGLKDFKKVQKPINDVVGKFFGAPATSTMTIKDINMFMTRQLILNNIVNNFLGRISMSEATLTGTTIAEIKSATDEQKLTSEIVNKFFEGSKTQDITTKFSKINEYIKDQVQLGIRALLISFFFNTDDRRMMGSTEIKANYLDIYKDLYRLKKTLKR